MALYGNTAKARLLPGAPGTSSPVNKSSIIIVVSSVDLNNRLCSIKYSGIGNRGLSSGLGACCFCALGGGACCFSSYSTG